MLEAYIIEEIRRRERDQLEGERPRIELPLPLPPPGFADDETPLPERPIERDPGRPAGVVILDL